MDQSLLAKASRLLKGPETYDRDSREVAIEPFATTFHLSALLERANLRYRSGHLPIYGDPKNVIDAKAKLCRYLKVPHLMVWEQRDRPDWLKVKSMLLDAAKETPHGNHQ